MTDAMREACEGMAWQFAYRGTRRGKLIVYTGGLSALEDAFAALGWDDPHFVDEEDNACEISGCDEWATAGQIWGGLYLRVCSDHLHAARGGRPRPLVKDWALKREAQRDPVTHILPVEAG